MSILKYKENNNWKNVGNTIVNDGLPIGATIEWHSNTIPSNWLLCDGSAVSRTEYNELFEIIGTTYGVGDGSTTFNLPNRSGKVGVGLDASDTDFNELGKTGGEKTHSLEMGELPIRMDSKRNSDTGTDWQTQGVYNAGLFPHNNLQPYIVTNYIIKAKQGIGIISQVEDNLTSISTINALSANQGKVLDEKINSNVNQIKNNIESIENTLTKLTPVTLYNNASGTTGTITLTQSAANFNFFHIYFRNDNNRISSVKVYSPNGKNVGIISTALDANTTWNLKGKDIAINKTSITHIYGCLFQAGSGGIYAQNAVSILRVDGYSI